MEVSLRGRRAASRRTEVRGCGGAEVRGNVMRTVVAILIGIVLLTGQAPRAGAQASTHGASVDLLPGSRVRVTSPATGRLVGTLVAATDDSLRVALASGSSLSFPTAAVSGLELSAGVQRRAWKGAGIGLLIGAGVGGAIGFATYRRSECYDNAIEGFFCDIVNRTSRSVTVMSDAALVGTAGGIVGALIGQVGRESWVAVSLLRDRTRVGVVRRSGFGITIAM